MQQPCKRRLCLVFMFDTLFLRTLKYLGNDPYQLILKSCNLRFFHFNVGNMSQCTSIALNTLAIENGFSEKLEAEQYGKVDLMNTAEVVGTLCKGLWKEPQRIVSIMDHKGTSFDSTTYASLLQGCVNTKALADGKKLHAHMMKTGFDADMFAGNNLVNMYAKCGSLVYARQVFDKMAERNVVSWTTMIAGYVQQGYVEEALKLFSPMQWFGVKPNQFTFASILRACSGGAALEAGRQYHAYVVKDGFESNSFVGNALLDMYAKCGSVVNTRKMFDKMHNRDVVSWNAMIAGYAQCGYDEEALELFGQMQRVGLNWDCTTFSTVLGVCASLAALELGKQLHTLVIKTRGQSNVFVGSTLVDMYAKCGRVEDARLVFDKMQVRNVVSWTAMIAGYGQHGNGEETLKLFSEMLQEGIKVNEFTYAIVLSACSMLSALKHGKQIHGHITKTGFLAHLLVGNVLIDMYAKSGSIESARNVFDKIIQTDVVSWNSIIAGHAQHGLYKEAFQLFQKMQMIGVSPNHITFVGVLSACSHGGLVDEGYYYLNYMNQIHGITPQMEHYTCMIGLLGHAGRLDEAEEFVNKMPFEPDVVAWRTLLAACRIHGNMELGKRVAECVLQFEPQDPGTYVLLSNMYAVAGRWEDVAKVRKMMKDRGVKKEPGLSWIEVKNRVHVFLVGDRAHPQTEAIYTELERLIRKMKKAGYVPNTDSVLLDLYQEQKEQSVCHHSEKLAIAFGLISTPSGTSIQVIKNLRVCDDCHTATKFISKAVGREIILRDASRFHHFKEGLCSCGDYW
eukprot:Gb_02998 [translate_table: standard]